MLASGTVSIVVPFRDVELYLRAALDSIRLQRYQDLQVILVDDGSVDASSSIAAEFARRDSRFVLVRTEGVGPGAARNEGLKHADGKFIAFVDGDDILPLGAIYLQVSSLSSSEALFCVGAFEHLENGVRWRSPWVLREHAETRSPVTLAQAPGITRNVFPWNKLFLRGFFDQFVGAFPEGTVYEDQVPTALAYASGEPFSVLSETVYHWRRRESQDSITQNRSSLSHIEARVTVLHKVNDIYAAADVGAYREWLKKSLFEDMRPFFEASLLANAGYHALLQETCAWLWSLLSTEEQQRAPKADLARTQAVLDGDFTRLAQLNSK